MKSIISAEITRPLFPEKSENSNDSEEEGTRHFMVNVIEPQFNLHSEEANVSSNGYFNRSYNGYFSSKVNFFLEISRSEGKSY